jgi:hypothetical protein
MIELPPLPKNVAKLPRDERGYPVPWFVVWLKGKPEFRVADGEKQLTALREQRCWVCGVPIGHDPTFVTGTLALINRCHGEAPCHPDCARFSAVACPYLTKPKARRREAGLPEGTETSGYAVERNPGVVVLWTCASKREAYRPFRTGNGFLYELPDPKRLEFLSEAREATREETLVSIRDAYGRILPQAVRDGLDAVEQLDGLYNRGLGLLPGNWACGGGAVDRT